VSPGDSFPLSSFASSVPGCCSSKKATCMTSRGFNIGALSSPVPGECMSQFSDVDLNGGFELTLTVCFGSYQHY
jgi:hypothetical protein